MKSIAAIGTLLACAMSYQTAQAGFVGYVRGGDHCSQDVYLELTTQSQKVAELRAYYQRDRGLPTTTYMSEFVHVPGPGWAASVSALNPPVVNRYGETEYQACGTAFAAGAPSRERAKQMAMDFCKKNFPGKICCVDTSGFDDDKTENYNLARGLKQVEYTYPNCVRTGRPQ